MRTALYCASMIVVTSCVSANARPHIARPYRGASIIACNDRGCTPTAAVHRFSRMGATRRLHIGRRESLRMHSHGRYARRRAFEESHRQARIVSASRPRHAISASHHHAGGVVTIQTAANPITVSSRIAGQMRALISDLVAHGFHGHITCLASGHMPHSLHHTGEACDFAQLRRNVVSPSARVMYHASTIIAAHGLRDGCSFHDCGHVDSGRMSFRARAQWIPGSVAHIRHYARRYRGHHFYRMAARRHSH